MEAMREPQVRDFRRLTVYQKAMDWIGKIREIVKTWDWEDKKVIGNQILRASTSVAANLAEGNGQLYLQKEILFINNALGSSSESQMWLEEARNARLIDQQTFERLDNEAVEVRKMLVAMIKKLKLEIGENRRAS
ncbi:four helix bundle protein [Brevibacillus borstelensis]|uniref:four helix bundle protein n=1 Tax=Brevibacillus borstelensis TaxID=45462 RepID=UPI00203ECAF1|nr:four helix bundle protein [Brevibacillus borstelensis]MCM3470191.1 four helix bundle protein [Brevibacillus borstelensis]